MMEASKVEGFILLELSFALILLTLGLFFSVPSLLFMKQKMLALELNSLYARLSYIRARAIASNKNIEITFDEHNATYCIDGIECSLHGNAHFGVIDKVKGPPSHPIGQVISPISFARKKLIFYPDGSMQAGTIYLTNSDKNLLYAITVPIGKSCLRKYAYDAIQRTWTLMV